MTFDRHMFADKLKRYLDQLQIQAGEIAESTGFSVDRLNALLHEAVEPSGDEVLILADFFNCDYKFFISNEQLAPFEQTEELFRKHSDSFNKEDRRNIQNFMFLCECQHFLINELNKSKNKSSFSFHKQGNYFKRHGQDAASAVRTYLGYAQNEAPKDVFQDFRQLGIHIFRRELGDSSISGVYIKHPVAGKCVLVNYSEDFFRQRFTAAHEVGHAILDDGTDINFSSKSDSAKELSEIRANSFASHYLVPPEFIKTKAGHTIWDEQKFLLFAQQLQVNAETFAYALKAMEILQSDDVDRFKCLKISRHEKADPELPATLNSTVRGRKEQLIKRGLSDAYVKLCFEAYDRQLVSLGRLAKMLLTTREETFEIRKLFGM